jgi:hypothetical protein
LKVASLVAGMVVGEDSIDDMAPLRPGEMGQVFDHAYAPPTLWSFPRSFTFGHASATRRGTSPRQGQGSENSTAGGELVAEFARLRSVDNTPDNDKPVTAATGQIAASATSKTSYDGLREHMFDNEVDWGDGWAE